ncbi:MAG: hypothetical protein ACRDKS_08170, partial [Actinomycetota bacterium]
PVVCSATEAVVREFSDQEMMFVQPGDLDTLCGRILDSHRDPAGRARRIELGRAAAKRFDWNVERERLLAAVAGSGAPRRDRRAGL